MADADQLETLTKSIVRAAERQVDVESDLVALRHRIGEPSVVIEMRERRRVMMVAAAAALVVVGVAGVGLVLARGDGDRAVNAPPVSPAEITSPTEPSVATVPPATRGPARPAAPGAPPAAPSTAPATTAPPVDALTEPFEFIAPVDGAIGIDYDTDLQPATLQPFAVIPFTGSPTDSGRTSSGVLWLVDDRTGDVLVIDLDGQLIGAREVPTTLDKGLLTSLIVGPENTIYALYLDPTAGDDGAPAAMVVAAFALDGSDDPVRAWSWTSISCEDRCVLRSTPDGVQLDDDTLPFVEPSGAPIADTTGLTDPSFSTVWEANDVNRTEPNTVSIVGPLDAATGQPTGELPWSLTIEQIVPNTDLDHDFQRGDDGSFLARIVLEPTADDMANRRDVLLWLDPDTGLAALDPATVGGLFGTAVRADSTLIGLAMTGDGIAIGTLAPATEPVDPAPPSSAPASPSTTVPVATAPATTAPATTAPTLDSPVVTLEPGGLNGIPFGSDTETAIAALTELLGAPDADTGWVDPANQVIGFCGTGRQRSVTWGNLAAGFVDEAHRGVAGFIAYSHAGTIWNGEEYETVESPTPAATTAAGLTVFRTLESASQLYGTSLNAAGVDDPLNPSAQLDLGGPWPITLWLDQDDRITIERIESGGCTGD